MASGRVGGTRSKIKGVVGNEVYQIVSDGKGGTDQIVYAKPEGKEFALTPELAKQRIFMSIVMRHMQLLTAVMDAAFENIPEGTLCVQNFARVNIRWMQEHYLDDPTFNYLKWFPMYGEKIALPFPLILTEGTFHTFAAYISTYIYTSESGQITIRLGDSSKSLTLAQFRDKLGWSIDEYLCHVLFTVGAGEEQSRYHYYRFNWKKDLDWNLRCDECDWDNVFDIVSSEPLHANIETYQSSDWMSVRFVSDWRADLRYCKGDCTIQFGYQQGKWRISQSQISIPTGDSIRGHQRYSFDDVFDSWYTDRL